MVFSNLLLCETPRAWLDAALAHQEILLVDHANCEKKAASTALNLMYQYDAFPRLLKKMARLAREELRHFEQVLDLMEKRGVSLRPLSAARYAEGMRKHMRREEPHKKTDVLIIGAFIEARSCERFQSLAPLLDEELGAFYRSLLRSEARHFQDYLGLARSLSEEPIEERIAHFAQIEAELVTSPDPQFRFHSGVPDFRPGGRGPSSG